MKKILLSYSLFFIFILNVNASYVVMNQDNGEVLYQDNMNKKMLIASTTKIMTAYIVIKNSDLNELVTVNDEVKKAYGSLIYLEENEVLTVKDLLYGLLLRSGNDAAIILANYISGSEEEFVKLMNKEALNIGMKNTHFENSTGIDDNNSKNISTAYDMALLTKKAMKNDTFRKIFKTKKYVCKSNFKSYIWHNKNKTLYLSKYVTGGKTGYTKKAKRTLVTTASKNGINLIIVTLNFKDDFNFHISTYNSIFKSYKKYLIVNRYNLNIDDSYYKKHHKYLYVKNNYFVLTKNSNLKKYYIKYILYKKKKYSSNNIVGKLEVYKYNKIIYEEPIYVKDKT